MIGVWLERARAGVSIFVLSSIYFLVVVPFSQLVSLFRDDPLQRGFEPERESYWEPRDAEPARTLTGFFFGRGKGWMLPIVFVLLAAGVLVLVTEGSMMFAFLYPLF